ncbi:hypothetical protein [Nocardioides mesophilus]|uniref:Uncharacterized protein n=1 Tax=Nocardioides mesophilus TaxID=433659 RepID=A0A7G9RB32_9ACTN|nr:hypothetical protein [Nocardioides mesophilus]QNN52807.1 hypothetical protein H9L09_20675 [Nocardioides mesophilus]
MNDDVNEVERLRARVAELENQPSAHGAGGTPARRTGHRSAWWAVSSAVLLTLACVLAPLSAVAVWANAQISDTDAYVQTVAPLAEDPAVQSAVADKVTVLIFDNLDIEQITTDALNTLAEQPNVPPRAAALLPGLAVPITDGVKSFTRDQVGAFVASPQFARIWEEVNRAAHTQVDKLLSGNEGGAVSAQGDTITLNLGPIVAQVKDRLVAQGFSLAQNIPPVDQSFVLVQSDAITSAQSFYQLLNNLGFWLPVIVVVLFVGGVMLARDRRRALLKGALGLTGAMIVLGVLLALARSWYVGATPADILTENAAGSVFDTLVRFLRTALRATAVLGLVLALAAFLTGPASGAVRTRSAFSAGSAVSGRGPRRPAGARAASVSGSTPTAPRCASAYCCWPGSC